MEYRLALIETESQLPHIGTIYETRMFDMKLRQIAGSDFHKAKDVAAFANATGGVILIGALEDQSTGHLLKYQPMTEQEAKMTREEFNNAVRSRCSPVPIVDYRIIRKDTGFVVAVNIWPFPEQVVGVKIRSDQADGAKLDSWVFPLRSGTHTSYLEPEQTAMLTSPRSRAVAISLSRIPMRTGVKIRLSYQATINVTDIGKVDKTRYTHGELHEYSLLDNRVIFHVKHPTQNGMPAIAVPMDAIQSVWQGLDSNEWNVALSGSIVYPKSKPAFYSCHVGVY